MDSMYSGSHVSNLPAGALTQPVWDSSLLRELLNNTRSSGGGPPCSAGSEGGKEDKLLRVSIPAPLTAAGVGGGHTEATGGPGGVAGFVRPARHRPPRQFDRAPVPRALRGDDIELMSIVTRDPPPTSLLSADEMVTAINVTVHVKSSKGASGASSVERIGAVASSPTIGPKAVTAPLEVEMPSAGMSFGISDPSTMPSDEEADAEKERPEGPRMRTFTRPVRRTRAEAMAVPPPLTKSAAEAPPTLEPEDTEALLDSMAAAFVLEGGTSIQELVGASLGLQEVSSAHNIVVHQRTQTVDFDQNKQSGSAASDTPPGSIRPDPTSGKVEQSAADPEYSPAEAGISMAPEAFFSPFNAVAAVPVATSPIFADPRPPAFEPSTVILSAAGSLEEPTGAFQPSIPQPLAPPFLSVEGEPSSAAGGSLRQLPVTAVEEDPEEDPLILMLLEKAAVSNARSPSPHRPPTAQKPSSAVMPGSFSRGKASQPRMLSGGGSPKMQRWEAEASATELLRLQQPSDTPPSLQRGIWVRDAIHDPFGVSNAAMAGMLTRAARCAVPGATVELPAAPCAAPSDDRPANVAELLSRFALMDQPATSALIAPTAAPSHLQRLLMVSPTFLSNIQPSPTLQPGEAHEAVISLALDRQQESMLRSGSPFASSPSPPSRLPQPLAAHARTAPAIIPGIGRHRRRPAAFKNQTKTGLPRSEETELDDDHDNIQSSIVMGLKELQQEDLVYLTMTAPPKPSVVPGKEQINKATRARMAVLETRMQLAAQPEGGEGTANFKSSVHPPTSASEVLMKAAAGSSMPVSLAGGNPAAGSDVHGKRYVPQFLRSKRESLLPPVRSAAAVKADQWEVPTFNSTTGFEAGMEAENGVVYYD